jgi:hypothetical protein
VGAGERNNVRRRALYSEGKNNEEKFKSTMYEEKEKKKPSHRGKKLVRSKSRNHWMNVRSADEKKSGN